eukprot:216152-Amphidinium_carterae.1
MVTESGCDGQITRGLLWAFAYLLPNLSVYPGAHLGSLLSAKGNHTCTIGHSKSKQHASINHYKCI